MKTNVWAGVSAAVFVALGIGLAAQSSAQNPPQSPSSNPPGYIMVTGCVQPAAAVPTGTSGTVGSASGETKFHLTKCEAQRPQRAGRRQGVHERIDGEHHLSTRCRGREAYAACGAEGGNQRNHCSQRQRGGEPL